MPWIDRTTRGPEADYLTVDALRELFGFPEDFIEDKISEGVFPPPIALTKKSKLFTWEHAIFISLWLKLVGPANPVKAKAAGEMRGDKG